jgi:hypothetical protein
MTSPVTLMRVLVASPDDVAAERVIVRELIDEFNSIWADDKGIRLEFVGWENFSPGSGTEPQEVIDRQLPEYEIFLGILWCRFGTKTSDAGSGTEHEFNRALERFRANPLCLRILVYFSDAELSPRSINPSQLRKVQTFQNNLAGKGVLYKTYPGSGEFRAFVRADLARQVLEFNKTWGGRLCRESSSQQGPARGREPVSRAPNSNVAHAPGPKRAKTRPRKDLEATRSEPKIGHSDQESLTEDEGFLDLVIIGTEHIGKVTRISNRLAKAMTELGERVSGQAEQIAAAAKRNDIKGLKTTVDVTAKTLDEFAARLEREIPEFAESYATAIGSFGRAAVLNKQMNPHDAESLQTAIDTIVGLRESLIGARHGVVTLQSSIASTPPLTTNFNRAKRNTLNAVESLLVEWDNAIKISADMESLLQRVGESESDKPPGA